MDYFPLLSPQNVQSVKVHVFKVIEIRKATVT